MSVASSKAQVKAAYEGLMLAWNEVCDQWDDQARVAFEREFLTPLAPSIKSATTAMDEMNGLLTRIKSDCR